MVSTLKIYEILEEAKIEDKQARAITRAIEQALENNTVEQSKVLATKEDIGLLKQDLSKLREELKVTIAEGKSETVRWMFIFWLGQIAVLATLFKLLK